MKKIFFFILITPLSFQLHTAAHEKSNKLFTDLLTARFLESNPMREGALEAEKLVGSFESLLMQQPVDSQTAQELAEFSAQAFDKQLDAIAPAKLIAAGQYLLLQGGSVGLLEMLKYKLADMFIKDHSAETIEIFKSIKSLGNQANLALQVLQQSGAIDLFVHGKDSSFLDSSLISYEQLAYILDVYADILAGKPVKLQDQYEQSFPSKIWSTLKSFVANHNQQILAGLEMAGSIALTAVTHGAAAPSIGVAAASIARAAVHATGPACCILL